MTYILRNGYDYYSHTRRVGDAAWTVFAIGIIGTFIAFFVLGLIRSGDVDTNNNVAETNQRIEALFHVDGQTPDERMVLASSLITAHQHGLHSDIDNDDATDAQKADTLLRVQIAANTGELPKMYTTKMNYYAFWHHTVLMLLIAMTGGWSLGWFCVYAFQTNDPYNDGNEFLMDLPWKRIWPIFFVLATAFPIGWAFYIVSAIRLYMFKRNYQDIDDEPDHKPLTLFTSEPAASLQAYIALRIEAGQSHIRNLIATIDSDRQELETDLQDLGEEIREMQVRRRKLIAEQKQLEGLKPDELLDSDPNRLQSEFDRLMRLPGISGIRVTDGQLSLLLKARMLLDGTLYDLGDWELRFGLGTALATTELRSGVRTSWGGGEPVYRIGGHFCFGTRQSVISENLLKGQILEAIELAIDSMQSVNDGYKEYVPRAFRQLEMSS